MSEDTSSAFLTVRELAALLRVSRKTAYLLVKTGEVPSMKVGGGYRIPRAELERQFEDSMTKPAA
jgi:excisionase family DNA binding protein